MTLNEFVSNIKLKIKDIESLYRGLVITELSLPNFNRNSQNIYFNSIIYANAINANQSIKLIIPLQVLEIAKSEGHNISENVSVDVTIDTISLDNNSTVLVRISKIIESGVSEQELFIKTLTTYCNENKFFDRKRKGFPSLIKKIALISTANTNTLADIISNLDYSKEAHSFKVNNTSVSLAEQINICQNDDYDLILLYRGGHEDKSMNIYSGIPVLDAIHNSNVHIGVALGHEVDTPFVYKVADSTYSTPTNFAQVINEYNATKKNQLEKLVKSFKSFFNKSLIVDRLNNFLLISNEKINNSTLKVLIKKQEQLTLSNTNINQTVNKFMRSNEIKVNNSYSNISNNSSSLIHSKQTELFNIKSDIDSISTFQINSKSAELVRIKNLIDLNINQLIDFKKDNMIHTSKNIASLLSKSEIKINQKKNRRLIVILVISLIICIATISFFIIKN